MPHLPYTPLRVHSDMSFGRGASSGKKLAERVAELALTSCALTDLTSMSGCFNFSSYMKAKNVQPLIGFHAIVKTDIKSGANLIKGDLVLLAMSEKGYKNLNHLLQISYGVVQNGIDKARVPETPTLVFNNEFMSLLDDVIVLSGNRSEGFGYASLHRNGGVELKQLQKRIGNRLYIEICRDIPGDGDIMVDETEEKLLDFAYGSHGTQSPIVGTTDCWYAKPSDIVTYEMLAFQRGERGRIVTLDYDEWTNNQVMALTSDDKATRRHVPDSETFQSIFRDLPEAIENTNQISQRCAFLVEPRKPVLPPFPVEPDENGNILSEDDELRKQAYQGLDERIQKYGLDEDVYKERLEFELGIIIRMGFPGYFLIVSDFIKWSLAHDIPVGPGRGSGAGSLVAWCLSITGINPIPNGLLFERFLNPDRVSMPDFDIDFEPDGRGAVQEYVSKKYGEQRVAAISSFGTIKSKSALDLTGRCIALAKGGDESGNVVSFSDLKKLRGFIDNAAPGEDNLKAIYDGNPEFQRAIKSDNFLSLILNTSMLVENINHHQTKHAAGIVIGGENLYNMFPVIRDRKTLLPMTGYDMKGTEATGAVKFDFLALACLTTIANTLKLIREAGLDVEIDTSLADDKVYKLLRNGMTQGVFQFASAGMTQALRQVKPDKFSEIVAITALFRPGPMKYLESYANRKLGTEEIVYPLSSYTVAKRIPDISIIEFRQLFPSIKLDADKIDGHDDFSNVSMSYVEMLVKKVKAIKEQNSHDEYERESARNICFIDNPVWPAPGNKIIDSLGETYGYFVYQEQVMSVARDVAGYTYAGADMLRRAMGKKIREEMVRQKGEFIEGCKKNGIRENDAAMLFEDIERFADYGFNKSHAVAYTVLTYQTAWLKCHYPEFFYSALLAEKNGDKDATANIINEIMKAHVSLLPPDIMKSRADHSPYRTPDGKWHILFGLSSLGHMKTAAHKYVEERDRGGPFKNIIDFVKRVREFANKKQYENLAKSGAMDNLDPCIDPRLATNEATAYLYDSREVPCRRRIYEIMAWMGTAQKDVKGQQNMLGNDSYTIPKMVLIEAGNNKFKKSTPIADVPEWANRGEMEHVQIGYSVARAKITGSIARLANTGVKTASGLKHVIETCHRSYLRCSRILFLPEGSSDKHNFALDEKFRRARVYNGTDGHLPCHVVPCPGTTSEQELSDALSRRIPVVVEGDFQDFGKYGHIMMAHYAVDAERYLKKVNASADIFVVLSSDGDAPLKTYKRDGNKKYGHLNDYMLMNVANTLNAEIQQFETNNPYGGRVSFMTPRGLKNSRVPLIPERQWRIRDRTMQGTNVGIWQASESHKFGDSFSVEYEQPTLFDTEAVREYLMNRPEVRDIIYPVNENVLMGPDEPRYADYTTYRSLKISEDYWEIQKGKVYGNPDIPKGWPKYVIEQDMEEIDTQDIANIS